MSDGVTHDAARDALEALALDALDATERDAVMAHVASCERCQSELAALEHTAGALLLAAAPVHMKPAQRDRIRSRLLARAAADRATTASPMAEGAERPGRRAEPVAPRAADVTPIHRAAPRRVSRASALWAAAASVVALLGAGAYLKAQRDNQALRDALHVVQDDRGARASALDSLRASLADRDSMLANLTGPQVKVMTLASTGPAAPTGRMFWDQSHDMWTFVAHHVP